MHDRYLMNEKMMKVLCQPGTQALVILVVIVPNG